MPKNIVICADGTGNSTVKGRGTNVFKLYEAVDENGHRFDTSGRVIEQVAIYHDGVGTESLKWLRLLAGATGWGLSRNVKDLYAALARVYRPGDRIYLFGFSRGAFTVRTLAGLIAACGIPDRSEKNFQTNEIFRKAIEKRYRDYRRKYQTLLEKGFRAIFGRFISRPSLSDLYADEVRWSKGDKTHLVDFVGVWDTVDAVGLPLAIADIWNQVVYAFKFPEGKLNKEVAVGRHALALDEARTSFAPVLWNEEDFKPAGDPRIKQVWFAGVHSNVGGGYPHQGMSLVALDWMMSEAASMPELGAVPEGERLRFIPQVRELVSAAADVRGKLYDSRSGLGVYYRWKPRDAEALCRARFVPARVHRTVLERIARGTDGYAPGSLPVDPEVVSWSAGPLVTVPLRECVRDAHRSIGSQSLVEKYKGAIAIGRLSYFGFLGANLAAAVVALVRYYREIIAPASTLGAKLSAFSETVTSSHWLNILFHVLRDHWWIVVLAAGAFVLSEEIDRRLDDLYSRFWHQVRRGLGRALDTRDPQPAQGRVAVGPGPGINPGRVR
jgi:uncharacterized protein (DUF2235 family)